MILSEAEITPDERYFPEYLYSTPSELDASIGFHPQLRWGLFTFGSLRARKDVYKD